MFFQKQRPRQRLTQKSVLVFAFEKMIPRAGVLDSRSQMERKGN